MCSQITNAAAIVEAIQLLENESSQSDRKFYYVPEQKVHPLCAQLMMLGWIITGIISLAQLDADAEGYIVCASGKPKESL